jgi:3-methyladenine DNA glycosylase AlkD
MEEINLLKKQFEQNSNSERAQIMSAYMKGLFPFYGIMAGPRKLIVKDWIAAHNLKNNSPKRKTIIHLLFLETERELQYAGIDLLLTLPKKHIKKSDLVLIKHLIVSKPWWDTVDLIASNYLGEYLTKFPEEKHKVIDAWRHSDHLWLKRSCLIFQLKYRNSTDHHLLQALIHEMKDEKEFFIQKAIGWSLREYSKHNPNWVKEVIELENLKGLAKREASKYI